MTSQRKRKAKLTRQVKENIKKKQQEAATELDPSTISASPDGIDDIVSLDKQQLASVLFDIKEAILDGIAEGVNEELASASPSYRRQIEDNSDLIKEFFHGLREGIEMEIADYIEQAGDKVSLSLSELTKNFTKALEPLTKGEGIIKEALSPTVTIVTETEQPKITVEQGNSPLVITGDEPTTAQNPVDLTKSISRPGRENRHDALTKSISRPGRENRHDAVDKVADLAIKARSTPTTDGLGRGMKASIFLQDVLANSVGLEDTGLYKKIKEYQLRKEHYVKNESEIRSKEFEGMTESEKRKILVKEFKSEDAKVKEMNQVNKRVEEMREKGYDENIIDMTKAGSRRQELAKELTNSPSSRFNEPFLKNQATTPAVNPTPTLLPVNEEAQTEAMAEDAIDDAVQKDQANSLANIDKNTADLKESIDGLKVSMKEAAESGKGGLNVGGAFGGGGKGPKKSPKGGKNAGALGKLGGMGTRLLGAAKGGILGLGVGLGADYLADQLGRETKGGAAADTLGSVATYASTGALIGSVVPGVGTLVGGALGGVAGAAKGLYDNWGTFTGDKVTSPKALPPNVVTMQQSTSGGELPPESKKFAEELGKNIVVRVPPPTVVPSKADTKIIEPSFTTRIKNNEPSISDYLRSRYAAT